jgi:hypothetical protein
MSDDLTTFLRARLDEDEQTARAAAEELGADWYYDDGFVLARREGDQVVTGSQDFLERERGEHIARHDPARVLADVEAKRQIIEQHKPATVSYLPSRERGCVTCSTAQTWDAQANEANCQTLCLLALPYADHPDYRDEWRP